MAETTAPTTRVAELEIHATTEKQHSTQALPLHSVESGEVVHLVKPQKKPFTTLSAMSMGYSITNTGLGMVLIVSNAVFGAGPLFIYGICFIFCISLCVAITLGELASAYPHAGGQYFWTAQLAPERSRRFLSYMTAIISWASVICIGASGAAGATNTTFALVSLTKPDFVYKQWMGFLTFQCYTWTAAIMVVCERALPAMSKTFMYFSVVTMITIVVCLLAPNTEKQSAAVVFGADGYFNLSGWPDGLACLIGISGINWGFSCLDAATHLAEEIPEPRKNVPKALLYTIVIGLCSGLAINLAIFFAATDLSKTTSILELLYTVYNGNPICAYVIGAMILVLSWGAVIGVHTWHSRIAWSLSRDKGFPFHSHLQKLAPAPFHTPLWAILWGVCWITLCGFLYLGSLTAFNAFISSGIVLQNMTYSLPAVLLLIKGRKNLPHGPFWWPRFGPIANIVLITWTLLTTVIYSFPYFLPVQANNMNYLSVVVIVAFAYAGFYWVLYGHKHYSLVDLFVQE
ncbi:choline transport protein [Talaromyces proteolyticus]|uniref:Choline transport protein n=1 Tax=Talaromyces proteolyticus TaxID=1131652 RepID=A0AAD4KG36_9EURO|nr:choline transport protein [Talaromyces proteolyticus]KAH8688662.1 choline transport protein [Talaromyces proteolyticus]